MLLISIRIASLAVHQGTYNLMASKPNDGDENAEKYSLSRNERQYELTRTSLLYYISEIKTEQI